MRTLHRGAAWSNARCKSSCIIEIFELTGVVEGTQRAVLLSHIRYSSLSQIQRGVGELGLGLLQLLSHFKLLVKF